MLRDIERHIEELIDQHGVLRILTIPLTVAGTVAALGLSQDRGAATLVAQLGVAAVAIALLTALALRNRQLRLDNAKISVTAVRFADRITGLDADYEILDWHEIQTVEADQLTTDRRVHIRATTTQKVVMCWQRQLGPHHLEDFPERDKRDTKFEVADGSKDGDGYARGADLTHLVAWRGRDAWVFVDLGDAIVAPAEKVLFFRTTWPKYCSPVFGGATPELCEWKWRRPVGTFLFELRMAKSAFKSGHTLGVSASSGRVTEVADVDGNYHVVRLELSNPPDDHRLRVSVRYPE